MLWRRGLADAVGNPAHHGTLLWLTEGVAKIAQWRFNLAMALAFPGILLYGIALFALQGFITGERQRKIYHYLMSESMIVWFGFMLWKGASGYERITD